MLHAVQKGWTQEEIDSVVGALDVAPVKTGKPRLLDLFCGAGGASKGYIDAGWDVMGLDNVRQPYYPTTSMGYILADFREFGPEWIRTWFDAVHASPPCQAHTRLQGAYRKSHVDLIPAVRELLKATGLPYVIENVEGAPLHNPILLCGDMFGLRVTRHRLFESNVYMTPGPCLHERKKGNFLPFVPEDSGTSKGDYRDAMKVNWMSVEASRQAIPPAYTHWIGERLLAELSLRPYVP
jgi:DNA (cytosine-5)-methyltransferase 1